MTIYPICQGVYIRKQSRLLWCQDLKLRHGFLGVQPWDHVFRIHYLKEVRNSLPSKVINAWKNPFKMSCFIYLELKKKRKRLAHGAESIPTDMEMSYLKTMLPIAWRNIILWEKI